MRTLSDDVMFCMFCLMFCCGVLQVIDLLGMFVCSNVPLGFGVLKVVSVNSAKEGATNTSDQKSTLHFFSTEHLKHYYYLYLYLSRCHHFALDYRGAIKFLANVLYDDLMFCNLIDSVIMYH